MKKTFKLLLSMVVLLSSCTDNGLLENAPLSVKQDGKVHVSFAPFESGNPATRTTIYCGDSDEGLFSIGDWDPDFDMIGLANVTDDELDSDYQIYQSPVCWETEDDGVSFTFFDPDDEQMLDAKSLYRIIYPFDSDNTYENERGVINGMYFYFDGQKQTEDNSTEHLSDYVFYHSYRFHWKENEPVNVTMESECSILKMELSLPAGIYKSITVENVYGDLVFDKYIKYDLPSGRAEHSRYTAYDYNLESDPNNYASPSVTLELNPKKFNLKGKENTCTFYLSVGASSTGCFRIKASTNKGKSYYTNILTPITLRPGKYYTIREKCLLSECPEVKETGTLNGYEWVDLGLTSHVKWAKINVGIDEHHKTGNYYAWGETVGHNEKIKGYGTWNGAKNPNYTGTKSMFNLTDYKWYNGQNEVNIKYQPLSSLEKNDDVASVKWGNGWRMPTSEEIYELFAECEYKFVHSYNGTNVSGMIFYKKNGSPDGPHIFLPASGYYNGDARTEPTSGYYWTSERGHDQDASAYYFSDPEIEGYNILWGFKYYYGFNVRPVCEAFE